MATLEPDQLQTGVEILRLANYVERGGIGKPQCEKKKKEKSVEVGAY